jgi:hypothetical protein
MKMLDCSTLYLPYFCKLLDYAPTNMAQCISCVDEDGPIAGVIYDGYNTKTISAHICVVQGKIPSRAWYGAIFDYPFNRLGVNKILGQVASNNVRARELDEHFGFVQEGVIKDYSVDGDLILYTMTKDQCRVLNSPRWNKTNELIRRVA